MPASAGEVRAAFPRFFRIGGAWVNSYKVMLCVGIYVGSLASAALAERSGLSPLRMGLGAMASALAGLVGARVYHVLVHWPQYRERGSWRGLWDARRGGWSVFGGLLTFVPVSACVARLMALPTAIVWDHMALGALTAGFWTRCGCVFNGCCAGRETQSVFGVRLHDTAGVRKRRVPVQFLEMALWLLGSAIFLCQWPHVWPPGSYALGLLGWYGLGRFFLEPLRERQDVVFGAIPIDRVVAALLAVGATAGLLLRL